MSTSDASSTDGESTGVWSASVDMAERRSAGVVWALAFAVVAGVGLLLSWSGAELVVSRGKLGSDGPPASAVTQSGGGYRSRYGLEAHSPALYNLEAAYISGMSGNSPSSTE